MAELGEEFIGFLQDAIKIYESIVSKSDNPEFLGKLSVLLRLDNRIAEAESTYRTASLKYKRLLKDFPQAMFSHAAGFYFDHQKNKLALSLLRKNLNLRTSTYLLWRYFCWLFRW